MTKKISIIIVIAAIAIAGITAVIVLIGSIKWRYELDSPLMMYAGFLLTSGKVPYRDFFDMNMPGTYFIMAAMGGLIGWSDLDSRIFDLICLVIISGSTFFWMRRFGKLPALAASILFPLWYLREGPSLSLQREYIALVPFSLLLVAATVPGKLNYVLRALLAGFLAGIAFLIKPQFLLLSLPPLLILIFTDETGISHRNRFAAMIGGILLPLGAVLIYMVWTDSLRHFIEIATSYWPLYTNLSGGHRSISGLRRIYYIIFNTMQWVITFYLPVAVLGLIALDRNKTQRWYTWMMVGLLFASILYPGLSGKFWLYHWIPFYYVVLCTASLTLLLIPFKKWNIAYAAPVLCVILVLLSLSFQNFENLRLRKWEGAPNNGVPDEIYEYFSTHMEPGDTVQPLDWTGGSVHGMLMARAPLATRFIYDFHFYHHISNPYIQKLRREFIEELRDEKPRFIIQVLEYKPWPSGPDTTREFPELRKFLKQNYSKVYIGETFRILEYNDDPQLMVTPTGGESALYWSNRLNMEWTSILR